MKTYQTFIKTSVIALIILFTSACQQASVTPQNTSTITNCKEASLLEAKAYNLFLQGQGADQVMQEMLLESDTIRERHFKMMMIVRGYGIASGANSRATEMRDGDGEIDFFALCQEQKHNTQSGLLRTELGFRMILSEIYSNMQAGVSQQDSLNRTMASTHKPLEASVNDKNFKDLMKAMFVLYVNYAVTQTYANPDLTLEEINELVVTPFKITIK